MNSQAGLTVALGHRRPEAVHLHSTIRNAVTIHQQTKSQEERKDGPGMVECSSAAGPGLASQEKAHLGAASAD